MPRRADATGHWSRAAPRRKAKAKAQSRDFQQPHKGMLAASSPSHSSPPLTPQPHCCHTKDEDLACTSWEGLALAPQPGSAPPHPMGWRFWVASAPLGSFPSNQGLVFFQPDACHHKPSFSPQNPALGSPPRGLSPAFSREVTTSQCPAPSTGRTLDSKRRLGGGWGGREEEQQPQQKPTLSFHKTAEFISLQPFTSVSSYKMKEALKNRGDEIKPSV